MRPSRRLDEMQDERKTSRSPEISVNSFSEELGSSDRTPKSTIFSPESKQMIQDVGNIEMCELLETEPKTQCLMCFIILGHWQRLLHVRALFFVKEGENQKFIKCTMDLLSNPEFVINKGRPHGHRYGKKPEDRECCTANQLKKKCKKKFFQGIHDRLIRDETFRNRMIENCRNEDVCR